MGPALPGKQHAGTKNQVLVEEIRQPLAQVPRGPLPTHFSQKGLAWARQGRLLRQQCADAPRQGLLAPGRGVFQPSFGKGQEEGIPNEGRRHGHVKTGCGAQQACQLQRQAPGQAPGLHHHHLPFHGSQRVRFHLTGKRFHERMNVMGLVDLEHGASG